jgi:hypothetical protein
MKNRLLLLLSTALFCLNLNAQEINIDGVYNGKNLYILNPSIGNGYCVSEVWVNGKKTKDEVNSNSFEIDFSLLGIKEGTTLRIRIFHSKNCLPKIINPEVLEEITRLSFVNIKINKGETINWEINGNALQGNFSVEQYRWKKWVLVNEISIQDSTTLNSYSVEIYPNTGQNLFRIKFTDDKGKVFYSKEIKYNQPGKELTITTDKIKDKIALSNTSMYEIFDEKNNLILQGTSKYIDVSELKKGKYFINYDNKTETFSIK